ncbi:MAG: hypothetical protein WAV98_01860 [Minisyncoccia bacterium]
MWKDFGIKSLFVTLAGYATLISYTWPQGFIPIVAVQSLPILLLGFALILLFILVFLGTLFLPFWFHSSEDEVRNLLYGNFSGDLSPRYKKKSIKVPIRKLLNDLWETHGIAATLYSFALLIIGLAVSIYFWYQLSSYLEERVLIIPLAYAMWLAFKSLSGALSSKSFKEAKVYLLGIGLLFVLLPSCSFTHKNPPAKSLFAPNGLVRDALKITGLGGGISIRVEEMPTGASELVIGHLIFSDGQTLWIKPCKRGDVARVQIAARAITYYENDVCHGDDI